MEDDPDDYEDEEGAPSEDFEDEDDDGIAFPEGVQHLQCAIFAIERQKCC